jgi:hypothetical protein
MPSLSEVADVVGGAASYERIVSPVMTTRAELEGWVMTVERQLGDPAAACGLLCIPWRSGIVADLTSPAAAGGEMYAGPVSEQGDAIALTFPPKADYLADEETICLPMGIGLDAPEVHPVLGVMRYQAKRVCAGVWALNPSLNVDGLIHAFVVLHGVPDPAPWERRIVLA